MKMLIPFYILTALLMHIQSEYHPKFCGNRDESDSVDWIRYDYKKKKNTKYLECISLAEGIMGWKDCIYISE